MTTATNPELASADADLLHKPEQWGPFLELPCNLTLELTIPEFTVADLLRLQPGDVVDSKWSQGQDVPVQLNDQLIAWAEFEPVGESLGMRVTEWA